MISSPQALRMVFFEKISGNPIPIRGRESALMLTLNPKIEIIQAVTVVPILAPRMTPADSVRLRRPAFTKLTTITDVAEEDWITAVINRPVKTPKKRLDVMAARILRILSPATF